MRYASIAFAATLLAFSSPAFAEQSIREYVEEHVYNYEIPPMYEFAKLTYRQGNQAIQVGPEQAVEIYEEQRRNMESYTVSNVEIIKEINGEYISMITYSYEYEIAFSKMKVSGVAHAEEVYERSGDSWILLASVVTQ